jgi:cobalt/nickel transport system permease protein
MSHLHVPDGVLPLALWLPGAILALLWLAASALAGGERAHRRLGLRGALGALMLAVMSLPIPLFALEYCLTLAGPVGVLVGAGSSVQVAFSVCLVLAFLGQGGFTVVGLNVLVLASGMTIARPVYRAASRHASPGVSMAVATAAAQLVSGTLWFLLLALALRFDPALRLVDPEHGKALIFGGIALGLWALAIFAESLVGLGLGRFLSRVRPDLLPGSKAGGA